MKKQNEQVEQLLHKLRGQQQTLSNFMQCLEQDLKTNDGEVDKDEFYDCCSIIIKSLEESRDAVEQIKNNILNKKK